MASTVYVLKIKASNKTGATLKDVEKYLKTTFKSVDYMMGFLDGYCFDDYELNTLDQFEGALNRGNPAERHFIKFVSVVSPEEDED